MQKNQFTMRIFVIAFLLGIISYTTITSAGETKKGGTNAVSTKKKRPKKEPSQWPESKACKAIYKEVLETLGGGEALAACYMGLFFMETTCDATLTQRAGNVGNAHEAYGLCSLEKSPAVREANNRGPDCENIEGVANQVKCCRAILKNTPRYFGPYIRGEVSQCG